MFRFLLGLSVSFVAISSGLAQTSISSGDIQTALSRAETLYYEAQFKESIQLLTPLDLALREQSNRVQESVKVKLQLALAHVGLNEMSAAKTRFAELCSLDPDYDLDPAQFAPKILALFSEARSDQSKVTCSAVCDEANRLLDTANLQALITLIRSAPKSCSCLQAVAKDAAELSYKQGLEAYKQDDFGRALQGFKTALALDPQHELSTQYIDLTQGKLQLLVDRLVLDWRKYFDAREFPKAAAVYTQLVSPNLGEKAAAPLEQIRSEYRKGASSIAETWKQNCSADPGAGPADAIQGVAAMLPDPSIAQDILEQIKPCAVPAPIQAQFEAESESCLQMPSQGAMVRLKSRVSPEIAREARPTRAVSFLVKVKIDKSGNVTVNEVQGPSAFLNNPIKAAVEQWKFIPAVVSDQPRCVETELPIMLNP